MGDLIQQLVDDHRTIEELCDRFCATIDAEVLALLCKELEAHDAAEALVLDPLVGRDLPIPRAVDLVARARIERDRRARAIKAVRSRAVAPTPAIGRVLGLALHHILIQESVVFPQIREHCTEGELFLLGHRLTEAKEQLAREKRMLAADFDADR